MVTQPSKLSFGAVLKRYTYYMTLSMLCPGGLLTTFYTHNYSLESSSADVFADSDSSFISVHVFMTAVWVELHTDTRDYYSNGSERNSPQNTLIGLSELYC